MGNCKACPRHPLNAPGDFYVEDGSCIACGAPEAEAPSLLCFSDGDSEHCHFRKQPETADEVDAAIRAVWSSCVSALRYGGRNPDILRRLAEMGLAGTCDHPLPETIEEKIFDCVLVEWAGDPKDGARRCLDLLRKRLAKPSHPFASRIGRTQHGFEFTYRPGNDIEVRILAELPSRAPGSILIWIADASKSRRRTAMEAHDVLRELPEMRTIRWTTRREWERGGSEGRPTPF